MKVAQAVGFLLALSPSASLAATSTATPTVAGSELEAGSLADDEDFAPEPDRPAAGSNDEDEDRAIFIEAIETAGNDKTERSVILRRLLVSVGDLLDDDKIDESRSRLLGTGYFKSAEFSLKRGSRRGRVVLVIEVEERNTITLDGLYLGFSDVTPIFAGIGVSERNFLGRGVSVGLTGVAGQSRRALQLGIFAPDLSDTPLTLSAGMVLVRAAEPLDPADPEAIELNYTRAGGTLGIGLGVGSAALVSLRYRLESVSAGRLPNLDPAIIRGAPSIQFDESVLSTLSLSFERDTRDDPFVPSQGGRIALAVELGSKVLASSYEFSKYTAELELGFNPVLAHSLRLRIIGGLIQGQTPFFNQFFVRDYAHFDFGGDALPRVAEVNFSSFTDYDDLLLSAGADYNIPIARGGDTIYRAFVFAGLNVAATASINELQEDASGRGAQGRVPVSFDLGLRLDTLVGQLTLSAGYVADLFL
ncbi:MAG: BamA/TamA family outer membrane protein [Deltaproteobacteria bacterium]|nr:BamA/TamA family outer membrane protein [Deltaproteobacteria bacterium]